MTIRVNTQLLILLHRMLKENALIIHQMQSLPSDRQTVASPVITIRQEQEHQSPLPSDRQTVASGSREIREELGIDPYTNPYELSLNN